MYESFIKQYILSPYTVIHMRLNTSNSNDEMPERIAVMSEEKQAYDEVMRILYDS